MTPATQKLSGKLFTYRYVKERFTYMQILAHLCCLLRLLFQLSGREIQHPLLDNVLYSRSKSTWQHINVNQTGKVFIVVGKEKNGMIITCFMAILLGLRDS